ncbi:COMM domain-containing protein 5 [Sciurus carolinensis]|uniref:COMM domain-containing protein 5 n=1 Tax=Sciurus carolinensis TaxID=30640 RepID=A0AA41SZJ9_SCICA|nr:COMM domain-containing protein 5 [Sciurus carolinensis]
MAAMARFLGYLDRSTFRKLLKLVVSSQQGTDYREAMQCLGASSSLSEEWLGALLAGTHTLLQQSLRLPSTSLKSDTFKDQLQELAIPQDLVGDLTSVVFGSQRPLLNSVAQQEAYRFEVPTAKFQKLQYNMTLILKEMADLERRCECRLQD